MTDTAAAPDTDTPMSPIELSLIIWNHRVRKPSPCPFCGAPRIVTDSSAGETNYRCVGAMTRLYLGDIPDREETEDHWRASVETITYHGDERLIALARELRALRAQNGEDMTVPPGAVHFPYGHGQWQCCRTLVHRGDDVWDEVTDYAYAHDPTHAPPADRPPVA